MKHTSVIVLSLCMVFISCASIVAKKPKLYSHDKNIMTLCCSGPSTTSCNQKYWNKKIAQHCPADAKIIDENKRKKIQYTEIPQPGLQRRYDRDYDLEQNLEKKNRYLMKKQNLSCITYQCGELIDP